MTDRQVIEAWEFDSADELSIALHQAMLLAKEEGHNPSTVCTENKRRMTLVRERI